VQTVGFDDSDKPTSILAQKPGGPVLTSFTYNYDGTSPTPPDSDLLQWARDKDNNRTTYQYDFLGRLTSAVEKASDGAGATLDSRTYTYDKASNRTTQVVNGTTTTYKYNAANQLCWHATGTPANACGSPPVGATTYSYDANGNTTASSAGQAASYNIKDQTTSYTPPGGSAISFGYAGTDQTERTSIAGTTQHNTLLGLTRQGTTHWTRDPGGTLISQNAGGTRHYYLTDRLGSTVGLTDSSGAITNTYKYDPHGNLRTSTGSVTNPFQYTGAHTTATGAGTLYKLGARYYHPSLGRWTQQDLIDRPADLAEGNRYAYAAGNPIASTDPTGLAAAPPNGGRGSALQYRLFVRCMHINIGAASSGCISDCFSCALTGFRLTSPACFHCVVCAGPRAIRAAKHCWAICRD
jgi:RHS repeat-associated protein